MPAHSGRGPIVSRAWPAVGDLVCGGAAFIPDADGRHRRVRCPAAASCGQILARRAVRPRMLGDLRGGTPQHLCGGGEPSGAQNEVFIQAFRVSQCGSNGGELVQRCLAVFDDLGGDNPGVGRFSVSSNDSSRSQKNSSDALSRGSSSLHSKADPAGLFGSCAGGPCPRPAQSRFSGDRGDYSASVIVTE